MTAREWLNRARRIDNEINGLEEEKQKLISAMTSGTASLDRTPVSGSRDPHRQYDALAALIARVDQRTDELYAIKLEIINAIAELPDSNQRAVMNERYILLKSFEQISVDLHYSYRQTRRIHRAALEQLEANYGRTG